MDCRHLQNLSTSQHACGCPLRRSPTPGCRGELRAARPGRLILPTYSHSFLPRPSLVRSLIPAQSLSPGALLHHGWVSISSVVVAHRFDNLTRRAPTAPMNPASLSTIWAEEPSGDSESGHRVQPSAPLHHPNGQLGLCRPSSPPHLSPYLRSLQQHLPQLLRPNSLVWAAVY